MFRGGKSVIELCVSNKGLVNKKLNILDFINGHVFLTWRQIFILLAYFFFSVEHNKTNQNSEPYVRDSSDTVILVILVNLLRFYSHQCTCMREARLR